MCDPSQHARPRLRLSHPFRLCKARQDHLQTRRVCLHVKPCHIFLLLPCHSVILRRPPLSARACRTKLNMTLCHSTSAHPRRLTHMDIFVRARRDHYGGRVALTHTRTRPSSIFTNWPQICGRYSIGLSSKKIIAVRGRSSSSGRSSSRWDRNVHLL
ncbi:hypothetical protein BD309DRAFT_974777 [Dichomitus squalens]|uniref:Uncharacterized protein n=1 Tax=Dichomitus squalens TaxID=114155 RepID=A0A4Q9PCP9_9APHY|nr:hypothetical protein BD309DRAFT_974777 [Dichomitus squalens]TBU52388.1 hypothetical protein BD310DRAFT_240945 [Dichomitus squalens]